MNPMGASQTWADSSSPFSLAQDAGYQAWRQWKLAQAPRSSADLLVPVADPTHLSGAEHQALLTRLERFNMAVYACAGATPQDADPNLPRALGAQLGLRQLDVNWLADDDGLSHITVSDRRDHEGDGTRGGFIPYTNRPIRWHTDGYYHPDERRIRAMVLHCVRPAARGGENALLDHERLYIALRDDNPRHIEALMQPDAMTIPARYIDLGDLGDQGRVARPAQRGPVFSLDEQGCLHLRYTARTRSIEWKADAATAAAVAAIESLLAHDDACGVLRLRLEPGMGLVCHNVLHDRSGFDDDPAHPRLLYRARYLDRAAFNGVRAC